jgi:hypothetical protein
MGLAQRIKANVAVLQVLQASAKKRWAPVRRSLRRGAQMFESTMASASFAEVGEHETARRLEEMLIKSTRDLQHTIGEEAAPTFSVQLTTGDPEVEISRFIVNDPDVVLAICDAPDADKPESSVHRLVSKLSVPAVTIHPKKNKRGRAEGKPMKTKNSARKAIVRALIFGALSAGLYAAVFINQAAVLTLFTKGGLYALLPVAAVFVFSYVHGNFASNVWTSLGIEASNKTTIKQIRKRPRERVERPRPRPVLRA